MYHSDDMSVVLIVRLHAEQQNDCVAQLTVQSDVP